MRKVIGSIRKAIEKYNLIGDGDKVAVGISGGKDSLALLYGLKLFQRFSPIKYELEAFTINLGFDNLDLTPIENFCEKIHVPYTIKKTNISKVIFDVRKEKNPCSLCANMRRGALHNLIKENGCNVLALGHHSDDAIETLFLSLFYEGRINTFSPKTYLSIKELHLVRPMIYLSEKQIISAVNRNNLPVVQSPCPVDKKTKREYMKKLLKEIYKDIPGAHKRVITALENKDQINLWFE